MNRKKILWKIFPPFLALIIISLLLPTWYSAEELRTFHEQETISNLKAKAAIFLQLIKPEDFKGEKASLITKLCKQAGAISETRITVIMPDGLVIGDNEKDPSFMDNHIDRPEIIKAIQGKTGWKIRTSDTLDQKMMYVAIPYAFENRIIGVIRTSIPMTSFEDALISLKKKIFLFVILIAFLAALVCLYISKHISKPIEDLKTGIDKFSAGELDLKLPLPDTEEIAVLAEAANNMAEELDKKIKSIIQNRNEQQAVLSSMAEGVIAVDNGERIIRLNTAAEKILETEKHSAKGRLIQEIVRNSGLLNFILKSIRSTSGKNEEEVNWNTDEDRVFHASGTILRDHEGNKIGTLIVLNEITRIYKLERIRRDFVANVSHELRTPITSIKGFAETIAEEECTDPEKLKHFAGIIVRQATRLNSIVEDLLSLSRIEKLSEQEEVILSIQSIKDVIDSAVLSCGLQATEKKIKIETNCPEDIKANLNPELFERALINLLENALKYSEPDKKISVKCRKEADEILLDVEDEGFGIEHEHQTRIFERFYRIDKARSRNLGGTGLGLSIVKHIAITHKGSVSLKSIHGRGSTFTIHLPAVK